MTPDPIKVATEPILPVAVTIIGTGDGASPSLAGTIAVTPGQQPNVLINIVTPLMALGVRFANVFLTGLLGILTGAMATNVIQASDFLHLVYKCAGLAIAGAGMGLIKDLVTIFGKLEQKNPLLTGSI